MNYMTKLRYLILLCFLFNLFLFFIDIFISFLKIIKILFNNFEKDKYLVIIVRNKWKL